MREEQVPGVEEPTGHVLASTIQADLLQRGLTVATAESITGGALGDLLSAAPGASSCFLGGVVSYATSVKVELLGVRPETVEEHGVISSRCAVEMAVGVRRIMHADLSVATTGVAGPTSQEGHPVGTVFVAVAGPGEEVVAHELHLEGEREAVRRQACVQALTALLAVVSEQAVEKSLE